jgi:hypothetical protein
MDYLVGSSWINLHVEKKMPIDIFLIFCHDILAMNYVTKVYFSLHIWKELVEIDQIKNFHEKIIWQSLLYRIPLTMKQCSANSRFMEIFFLVPLKGFC